MCQKVFNLRLVSVQFEILTGKGPIINGAKQVGGGGGGEWLGDMFFFDTTCNLINCSERWSLSG